MHTSTSTIRRAPIVLTFAIGMDTDAIDLKYARQTAEYLGSEHHEIIINRDMVISSLEEVIRLLGTWDITTIRASMGMYLLCKAIHEQTDVRVLLTGEISDELFGYKYTDYAPTADAFQQESQKRIRELYMYDVLRAYMLNYFSMMMAISSIFLTLDGSKEALAKRKQLWDDLKAHDGHLYRRCRFSVAEGCNLPGWLGSKISIGGYRIAQKIFKFN